MAKKKNTKCKPKKTKSNTSLSTSNDINTEAITATLGAINPPILLKVCRLCETKDGPFLNIFDSEKVVAKKIDELMPFWVAENDDLPHKICFRCSAKVEELHEFVQKCVGSQENLRKTLGKKGPLPVKSKTRAIWEHKLNQSNMSNDDICDALIKKAMESIQDKLPQLFPLDENDKVCPITTNKGADVKQCTNKVESSFSNDNDVNVALKDINVSKKDANSCIQSQSSNTERQEEQNEKGLVQNTVAPQNMNKSSNKYNNSNKFSNKDLEDNSQIDIDVSSNKNDVDTQNNVDKEKNIGGSTTNSKPFNIMDHVTMIKVHGVGVLFQCKICNRNFLKKSVVISHACAKTGVPKLDISNMYLPPEPLKLATVKYIKTIPDKSNINVTNNEHRQTMENKNDNSSGVTQVVKKKIGPASKIGRPSERSNATSDMQLATNEVADKPAAITQQITDRPAPTVSFPNPPSLNIRYKLVPGPNNTFSLVEDKTSNNSGSNTVTEKPRCESPEIIDLAHSPVDNKPAKKVTKKNSSGNKTPENTIVNVSKKKPVVEQTEGRPYPVGLFQTVSHHSGNFNSSANTQPKSFTTSAMKKQSYTVVQTGHPNKLLISTKSKQAAEEVPKKRTKKTKVNDDSPKPSFSVVLEDTSHPKDPGFFTFINVDPLLQPSYVLPTDNIIQESQITTSTPVANKELEVVDVTFEKNKYTCNMCGEKFNREKKLNAHIYSHYNIDDDDDDVPQPTTVRKRGWK